MLLLEGKVPRSSVEAFLGSYVGLPEALKKKGWGLTHGEVFKVSLLMEGTCHKMNTCSELGSSIERSGK